MQFHVRPRAERHAVSVHAATALVLGVGLWLLASPALAAPTTFFGQDIPANGAIPLSFPNSNAQQTAFLATLVNPGTEDFSEFSSGDEASLDITFRNPAGSGAIVETGTLDDDIGDGFIATAAIAKTGFPISVETYWKNTTSDDNDEGLFVVDFDAPVRAFGFYATAWETLSHPDRTQLVLELELVGGGTETLVIPHDLTSTVTGKTFFFGVITDPFTSATLRNSGDGDGDVIGFDDFTVAHTIIPEPGTGWLLGGGMLALAAARRRAMRRCV